MPTFDTPDGLPLTFHRVGTGEPPLVCLPGGPMQASAYLGDLGGLPLPWIRLDLRGTGSSATPADTDTYRVDRQVDDVEALRSHLGLERLDLLGHSAGASLALLYAARYPERIRRLVLITPSPAAVGLAVGDDDRRQVAELRRGEPWFADAFAAFGRIWSGSPTGADWEAITPFLHGRWDAAGQAQEGRAVTESNAEAASAYYAEGALDPDRTRAALAALEAPVLLVAGGFDVSLPPEVAAEYVKLFPHGDLAVLDGCGHYPWVDAPEAFTRVVGDFVRPAGT